MKRRSQTPDSDNDLPEGWVEAPLETLTKPTRPRRDPQAFPQLPFVGMEQVESHTRRLLDTLQSADMKSGAFHFQPGDVLYGRLRPYLNKVHCTQLEGLCSSEFIVLPPSKQFAPEYLAFYLSTDEFVSFANRLNQGDRPRVSFNQIAEYELPLPPLAEQKRIVAKVEELLARVNAARAQLVKVPAILKRFRQSVLAAACSGKLTDDWREDHPEADDASGILAGIERAHRAAGGHKRGNAASPTDGVHDLELQALPESWRLTDLRTAVCPERPITYGILKPGPDVPTGIPYVRVADFPDDRLNLAGIRRTSKEIERQFTRARLRAGDVLLSIRGTVGRVCLVPSDLTDANITQDTARLSIQEMLDARYVAWFLRAKPTQDRMKKALKGVAVRGINIGDVRAIQLPVPPLAEQREIVRRVDRLFALADLIEKQAAAGTARVGKLTQAILAKAFRGELVPTEAELARREGRDYEPAEKLLERIRTAQELPTRRVRGGRRKAG